MSNLNTNTVSLRAILDAVNSPPEATAVPVLQTKTVTPTTSQQNVTPDSGYDGLEKVSVAAIPSSYEDVATATSAYTTKLGQLETAIAALEQELEGKASGSSGGSDIEIEVVTIPEGVDTLNIPYSLPRISNAYGGINVMDAFYGEGVVLGVKDNRICLIDNISSNGLKTSVDTITEWMTYSNGVLSAYLSLTTLNSIDVVLINDPSKDAISK